MPESVKFIVVDGSGASYEATLQAVTQQGDYTLQNTIRPGSIAENDLSRVEGLRTGTNFEIKIATTDANNTSDTVLTYDQASSRTAFFSAEGDIYNPIIIFSSVESS